MMGSPVSDGVTELFRSLKGLRITDCSHVVPFISHVLLGGSSRKPELQIFEINSSSEDIVNALNRLFASFSTLQMLYIVVRRVQLLPEMTGLVNHPSLGVLLVQCGENYDGRPEIFYGFGDIRLLAAKCLMIKQLALNFYPQKFDDRFSADVGMMPLIVSMFPIH